MTSCTFLPFIDLHWKLNLSIEVQSKKFKNSWKVKRIKTVTGYIYHYQYISPVNAQEAFLSALNDSEIFYQYLSFSDYYVSSQYFYSFLM